MNQLHQWDTALSQRLGLTPNDKLWPVAVFTAHIGDGYWVLAGLIVLYLTGWLMNQPQLQHIIGVLFLTLVATALIVFIIKYALRRERPRDPTGFVAMRYDKHSFPSGHAARMSCLATTLFFFNPSIGLTFLLIALLVALARVQVRVHFLGDVIAGLLVGALTASALMAGLTLA